MQWSAATTQPVTAYTFTAPSHGGGTVPAWATAVAYAVGNLVSDGGNSYMCTVAHTSASASEPGIAANWPNWTTYWVLAGAGTKLITFTASGHNFQVGQLVAVQGLSSNTGMNGNAYLVTKVSGSTFTVAYPYNGNPDNPRGSAQRRIPGTVSTGLSGNILNYTTASRIDSALMALIGGAGTCDTNNCYIRGQGERSYLSESTNAQAEFYVRMADNDSASTYPDDYSTGTYTSMTTYVSLSGRYTGTVVTTASSPYKNPHITSGSYNNYYYQAYQFTTTGASHIDVTLSGTWSGNSFAAIYNSTNFTTTPLVSNAGSPASLSYNITTAGTYYLIVSAANTTTAGTYTLISSQELTNYTPSGGGASYTNNSQRLVPPGDSFGQPSYPAIGSIPVAQIKIKIPLAARQGVIQQTFNQVRYGLMVFNLNSGNEGKILVGCDNTNLNTLLSAFNGLIPYNGTPTGEALYAAMDYFQQSSANSGKYSANNSAFIAPHTSKDPYFSNDITGTPQPVPCRQANVVLISDGGWNGSYDPIVPARLMHVTDLRTDSLSIDPNPLTGQPYFAGQQSVNVYTIFAFDPSICGAKSMQGIAMFGGFTDDQANCGGSGGANAWPYPYTTYPTACEDSSVTCSNCDAQCPTGSLCMNWHHPKCDPTVPLPRGHSYDTCGKEWYFRWDSYTQGDNLDKGVPDNYFRATEGSALQAAFMQVIQSAMAQNATASAVA